MGRTYESTHPWLRFALPDRPFPSELWVLLGEAQSKIEHLAGVPLRPETADRLHRLYLAKGARATTAIEGNTLSEEEVEKHLAGQLELPPSKQYLQQEIENIVSICNEIGTASILSGDAQTISAATLREFNRRVLVGLDLADGVVPGEIRKYSVGVGRYRGAPPDDCEYLLERLSEWLSRLEDDKPTWLGTAWAVLRAAIAHLYIAWIHPFGDGNGRTARLVEFSILVDSGVPTPAAHLLSNHYNETRSQYYLELDRSSNAGGDILPFVTYAVRGLVDGLRAQIGLIQSQQMDVVWRNFVHEQFNRLPSSAANSRRKHLVLDISRMENPLPIAEVMTATPRLAREYAKKTQKTLTRDLAFLRKQLDLISFRQGAVIARTDRIRAFLPERKVVRNQGRS